MSPETSHDAPGHGAEPAERGAEDAGERRLHVRARDGLSIHLRERGEGPPLVLLHGFTGAGRAWGEAVLAGLAGEHRVLAVDLPGHGDSGGPPEPERYRMERVVGDLGDVLDALAVERAVWVGYSMGGRIAVGAAVLAPARVEALVLESASPGLAGQSDRDARRKVDEALARRLLEKGMEDFVDYWMGLPLFASQATLPAEVRAAARARRLRNRPEALAACLRGLGTGVQPSFWDQLPGVDVPTLLIAGAEDRKFIETARRMAERLPRAQAATVPGAGHTVHLEAPATWVRIVTAFLDRSRAP